MDKYKIVRSSNFDKDWYNEEFVNLPPMSKEIAEKITEIINMQILYPQSDDYYQVVAENYKLYIGMVP